MPFKFFALFNFYSFVFSTNGWRKYWWFRIFWNVLRSYQLLNTQIILNISEQGQSVYNWLELIIIFTISFIYIKNLNMFLNTGWCVWKHFVRNKNNNDLKLHRLLKLMYCLAKHLHIKRIKCEPLLVLIVLHNNWLMADSPFVFSDLSFSLFFKVTLLRCIQLYCRIINAICI